MGKPNAQSQTQVQIKFEKSYDNLQIGFLQGGNPRAYKRLMTFASMNAARTMVKPMQAAAPKRTGRLSRSVSAKGGRYQQPSATVGPRPGKTRADTDGAWYRWMVTSGHKVRGPKSGRTIMGISWADIGAGKISPVSASGGRVAGKPFVTETARQPGIQQRALDAYYATIEKFLNDDVFRGRILKFKRRGR